MTTQRRVLVAGATGYLGGYVTRELKQQGYWVRALSRSREKIGHLRPFIDDLFLGEATNAETLKGICKNIDIVFSSVGITRQKDGLTYMDVDYHANKNILDEACSENVSAFMYVSVFNADKLRHLKIVKAKERFAEELIGAGIRHIIVRPNGFFSDISEVFKMAKKGRVYLLGNGEFRGNPIHGEDLARACVEYFESDDSEFDIGGPEILSQKQIALESFEILQKRPKTTHIPLWAKDLILWLARTFTSAKTYGPLEFFMTVMSMDMIAPCFGSHTIREYFKEISEANND